MTQYDTQPVLSHSLTPETDIFTPLILISFQSALETGDLVFIKECLCRHPDYLNVNLKSVHSSQQWLPIEIAVKLGHDSIFSYLIESGCLIPSNLLHLAVSYNCIEMVQILFDQGLIRRPSTARLNPSKNGSTSMKASDGLNEGQEKGDLKGHSEDDTTAPIDLEWIAPSSSTALQRAVMSKNGPIFDLLIHIGANPFVLTSEHGSLLNQLTSIYTPEDLPLLQSLLDAGIDPNSLNSYQQTALHELAAKASVETIRILIKAGADIHAQDHEKDTPLNYAAAYGRLDIVQCLVEAGADISMKNQSGHTVIDILSLSCEKSGDDLLPLIATNPECVPVLDYLRRIELMQQEKKELLLATQSMTTPSLGSEAPLIAMRSSAKSL